MSRFLCIVGGSRAQRDALARSRAEDAPLIHGGVPPAARWPFQRDVVPSGQPPSPGVIVIPDLDHAFPAGQTSGTRLVLTQSSYQLQRWIDWLDAGAGDGIRVIAHAHEEGLRRGAPEAFQGRGPWSRIQIERIEGTEAGPSHEWNPAVQELQRAFRSGGVEERLEVCRQAAAAHPDEPALHLAVCSAYAELQQLDRAQEAVERAMALAPDWEAPPFEYGKLWLRADDLERAAERFADAARLMPSFAAALSNLGAALAELEQPDRAIATLQQALAYDPAGYPILTNLAVIYREQGRLDEALAAGRRVIALAPDFVFGRYNLAHTLFLQGRFDEARDAYADAHARDPQKNLVQAARLAVARAAAGDADAAITEIEAVAQRLPAGTVPDVLGEAEAVLEALAAGPRSGDAGVQRVLAAVRALTKSNGPS